MDSLYSRLFRYRERSRRSPLEDYLTEALADFLSRSPLQLKMSFISEVLIDAQDIATAWSKISDQVTTLDFITQKWTDDLSGRMDLVVYAGERVIFVIECKVRAAIIGDSADGIDRDPTRLNEEADTRNQLMRYGDWLENQPRPQGWNGGLVLLSHFMPPPTDFLVRTSQQYGSAWCSAISWARVHRWLINAGGARGVEEDHEDSVLETLATELARFLEERNMAVETLTSKDVAAAELFVDSVDRFSGFFDAARHELEREKLINKKMRSGNYKYWDFESHGRLIWEWFYLSSEYAPHDSYWFVSWGVRFPETSKRWLDPKPPLPSVSHAFVNLGSEKLKIPLDRLKKLSKVWSIARYDGESDAMEMIAGRALGEFSHEADQFPLEFGAWVKARMLELEGFLPELKKLATK